MPLYVFQTSGNPFVRILIGLVSFAVLVGLGFLMLPVVLAVIAAVMVMGLGGRPGRRAAPPTGTRR